MQNIQESAAFAWLRCACDAQVYARRVLLVTFEKHYKEVTCWHANLVEIFKRHAQTKLGI